MTRSKEDWDEDDETSLGICDQCGKTKKVILSGDPYTEYLYPKKDNPPENWCYDCFTEAKNSI
jgi:hypothetical protein